jgi:hypothetical protein
MSNDELKHYQLTAQSFLFLCVIGTASLLAAHTLVGDWGCWQVACEAALCNPCLRHITLGRTPLDEWSARCRDLYLTTHNTHKKRISITWSCNLSKPVAAEPRLRPCDHCNQPFWHLEGTKYSSGLRCTVPLCESLKYLLSAIYESPNPHMKDRLGVRIYYNIWKCRLYESQISKSQDPPAVQFQNFLTLSTGTHLALISMLFSSWEILH